MQTTMTHSCSVNQIRVLTYIYVFPRSRVLQNQKRWLLSAISNNNIRTTNVTNLQVCTQRIQSNRKYKKLKLS